MSTPSQRLGRYVKARREELDLTQLEVWQRGGPSNTTQTTIENGLLASLQRATARKIDAGMEWQEGSSRTVWKGGEPTPLAARSTADLEAAVRASNISARAKEDILRMLDADKVRDRERGELA